MSSYQALYRAWRPERFEDIAGQDAIVKTLQRQIVSGHIAHAYLFCGSRGTGKTTTAKVLARAINCRNSQDGEPCGVCDACIQLKNENSMDILEIDAASNNSVDEVRLLRDRIAYPPSVGRYKVYIIDEVHMLSNSAFNALLKTLEEPPAHAVFILATTEPQKLPATVLSRCQRYDFRRIAASVIIDRMQVVLDGIGRTADTDALYEIARAAEGGMRDALSLLDMCLSYTSENVTALLVREVLGTAGRDFMFKFTNAIEEGNAATALLLIDQAMRDGRDAGVFARETAQHMRIILMARLVGDNLSDLAEIAPEDAVRFVEQSARFEQTRLMRALDLFIRAESEMKWVSSPRSILEVCAVRACAVQEGISVDALTERVESLEKQLKAGTFVKAQTAEKPAPAATPAEKEKPVPAHEAKPASSVKTNDEALFDEAVASLSEKNPSLRAFLSRMKFAGMDADVLFTVFDKNSRIQMQLLEKKTSLLEQAFSEKFGRTIAVNMKLENDAAQKAAKAVSSETMTRTFEIFGRDKVEVID